MNLNVLAPVADMFGMPPASPAEAGTVMCWPDQAAAVTSDHATAVAYRRQRWNAVWVGATFESAVSAYATAARQQADVSTFAKAVIAMCRQYGPVSTPQISADGKHLRWPDAEVIVTFAATKTRRAGDDTVFNVSGPLPHAINQIRAAALCVLAESSAVGAANPSSHEGRMMKGLLSAGLPAPVCDLKLCRADRSTYSQPDFAWPDVKLLLDLDGWYFHAAGALDIILSTSTAADARRVMQLADKTRFERDAMKRRQATVAGWTVMTVTDIEIDRAGTVATAQDVLAVYRRLTA